METENDITENDITEGGKYYVPELSEIHDGLLCECKIIQIQREWRKGIFEMSEDCRLWVTDGSGYRTAFHPNKVRVKYLDHDDIVNCGWEHKRTYDKDEVYKGAQSSKHEYEFGNIWEDKIAGWLEWSEPTKVKIITIDEGLNQDGPNHSIKFCGTILNKSELQFQMKRVGF